MATASDDTDEGDGTLPFPIEFFVLGTPLSHQASSASITAWKEEVRAAGHAVLPTFYLFEEKPLAVEIIFFAPATVDADIDNIIKPILDALIGLAYPDDHVVEYVSSQKIEPETIAEFPSPSPTLAEAIGAERPVLYVRIIDDLSWRVIT